VVLVNIQMVQNFMFNGNLLFLQVHGRKAWT
jgi:hypothetical protein